MMLSSLIFPRRRILSLGLSSSSHQLRFHAKAKEPAILPSEAPRPILSQRDRWVVFADLHIKSRNADSCLEVLRFVHREAEARKAGVIFLGDFWDNANTGFLNLQLLNDVTEFFDREWKIPMAMIPGNHDMTSGKGLCHGLNILQLSMPHLLKVFTEPALERGALWLPYRNQPSALAASLAEFAPKASVVFCHADIKGAFMSSKSSRSSVGLDFSPTDAATWGKLSIYSGHYHYPGTHPNFPQICYVGSPYQVKANEADQQKRLLYLKVSPKTNKWALVEEIPVPETIAPRHFRVRSAKDLAAIMKKVRHQEILPGDRIIGILPESEEENLSQAKEDLKSRGVLCQVGIDRAETTQTRISDADQLVPSDLLARYCQERGHPTSVLSKGNKILEKISTEQYDTITTDKVVNFEEIEISGFGPFLHTTVYPLSHRGLTVVQGVNKDDPVATSNGSGKSMLFSSLFWILLGKDPQGRTRTELHNLASKKLFGKLTGTMNGEVFVIERKQTATTSSLKFSLGGRDLTEGVVKTQELINHQLLNFPQGSKGANNFVLNCIYFAKGEHNGIFDKTPKEKDDILRTLFRLGVWEEAKQLALGQSRELAGEIGELEDASLVARTTQEERGKTLTLIRELNANHPRSRKNPSNLSASDPEKSLADLQGDLRRVTSALNLRSYWESYLQAKARTKDLPPEKDLLDLRETLESLERRDFSRSLNEFEREIWQGLEGNHAVTEGVVGFVSLLGKVDHPSLSRSLGNVLEELGCAIVCRTNSSATFLLSRSSQNSNSVAVLSLESVPEHGADAVPPEATATIPGCLGPAADLIRLSPDQEYLRGTVWRRLLRGTFVFETKDHLLRYLNTESGGKATRPLVSLDGYTVTTSGVHRQGFSTNQKFLLGTEKQPTKPEGLQEQIESVASQLELWEAAHLHTALLRLECEKNLDGEEAAAERPGDLQDLLRLVLSRALSSPPPSPLEVSDCFARLEERSAGLENKIAKTQRLLMSMEHETEWQQGAERAENAANTLEAEISELEMTTQDSEAKIEMLQHELKEWQLLESIFSRSEIEAYAREVGLARLQIVASKFIQALCGDYLAVRLTLDSKSQLVLNISIGGDSFRELKDLSKSALSSGQRERLELCLMLAMSLFLSQRFHVQFNTLFFDEIFSHLDIDAQAHVLQLLPTLLPQFKNPGIQFSSALSSIFVISHGKEMEGPWSCDHVVRVNGASTVELGKDL